MDESSLTDYKYIQVEIYFWSPLLSLQAHLKHLKFCHRSKQSLNFWLPLSLTDYKYIQVEIYFWSPLLQLTWNITVSKLMAKNAINPCLFSFVPSLIDFCESHLNNLLQLLIFSIDAHLLFIKFKILPSI